MSLFCPTQRKIFWTKFVTRLFWGTIDFHSRKKNTMEINGAPELLCFPHSSEYLPLCSAEQRHSYRFGTTWGWVNDDRIFIFGWTIPLTTMYLHQKISTMYLLCSYCCYWYGIQVRLRERFGGKGRFKGGLRCKGWVNSVIINYSN